jgi:release factor glutamine methyltransferase
LDDPQREARHLMSLASDLSTSDLILKGHQVVPSALSETFEQMVGRREAREPFQHIAGTAPFYGLDLISDARALVPRQDSEVVVEAALRLLPDRPEVRIADLGTGSGCLLVAMLVARPDAVGVGVEADPAAAALATENITVQGLSDRAEVAMLPWADWGGWDTVDLIISNPPYIRTDVIATLEPEVRDHDPAAALDGGSDGLDAYREIASLARARLKPGAQLVLEIGFDQLEVVRAILSDAGLVNPGNEKDLGGNDRVIWASQPVS